MTLGKLLEGSREFCGWSNLGGEVDDAGWQVGALAIGVAHEDDVVEILPFDFADVVIDYPISSISEFESRCFGRREVILARTSPRIGALRLKLNC